MSSYTFPQGNTRVFNGADTPSQAIGDLNDIYIQENGDVWLKTNGHWKLSAKSTKVGSVIGAPLNSEGKDGDLRIDETTGRFYLKSNGSWVLKLDTILESEEEKTAITFTSAAPSGGLDGDVHFRTSDRSIHKKVAGSWTQQTTLDEVPQKRKVTFTITNSNITGNLQIPVTFQKTANVITFRIGDPVSTTSARFTSATGPIYSSSGSIPAGFRPFTGQEVKRVGQAFNNGVGRAVVFVLQPDGGFRIEPMDTNTDPFVADGLNYFFTTPIDGTFMIDANDDAADF